METFRKKFNDIILLVSWREISRQYFGKDSSWIYRKMDHIDDDDPNATFTEEEIITLRQAFHDIAIRINKVADEL